MYKAIVFSRVSSLHQDLVQQTDEVFAEALKNGYKKEELIFIEQKESAIKLDEEERIGLQQLKSSIEEYPIECVFVYEVSRISRRPKVLFSIRDLLIEKQIQLVCIKPYLRLLDNDGKLSQTASIMFSIFSSLSESEMMLKKERMRRGVRHAKALGKHAGGQVMFGYTTDKEHNYILDPIQSKIVKRIFEDYVAGKSMRLLTRDLQEEGIFSNVKYLTALQEVYDVLHRECYTGNAKGKPAIITQELYNKSVERRKNAELKVNHTDNMSLLKGILRDFNTSLLLSSNTATKSYYSKREKGVSVNMAAIEPFIWDISVELHKSLKTIGSKQLEAKLSKRIGEIYMIRGNQVQKKKEIQEKIDKLEERLILGKISEEKANDLEKRLYDEMKEIERRANELNNEIDELARKLNYIKNTGDTQLDYDNLKQEERFNIVHEVIDKVILRRISRTKMEATVYNKVNENIKILIIDTYHRILLDE